MQTHSQRRPLSVAAALASVSVMLCAALGSTTQTYAGDLTGCTLNPTTTAMSKLFPTLCIDLETTGAKVVKLSNSTNALQASCADWAKPRITDLAKEPVLYTAGDMTAEGQPVVRISFAVYKYAGPGTYDETKIIDSGQWRAAVTFGAYPNETIFGLSEEQRDGTKPPNPGKAAMDVKADGNLTLAMTGLSSPVQKPEAEGGGYSHHDRMDAKITIRCVDPVK